MKGIDAKLTQEEKKILTYLLSEYKLRNRFPDINETK